MQGNGGTFTSCTRTSSLRVLLKPTCLFTSHRGDGNSACTNSCIAISTPLPAQRPTMHLEYVARLLHQSHPGTLGPCCSCPEGAPLLALVSTAVSTFLWIMYLWHAAIAALLLCIQLRPSPRFKTLAAHLGLGLVAMRQSWAQEGV